jgi:type II secretory pathway component PulF
MSALGTTSVSESPLAQATAVTCLLLAGLAYAEVTFVVPTFTAMMAGVGESYSWPSRLALGLARFNVLWIGIGIGGLGWLYWRGRQSELAMRRFETMLGLACLLVTTYVSLLAWTLVDAAIALPSAAR